MEKLEIKLTLTAASTPELLTYLRGIQSARDRAYILKRLATRGLMSIDGVTGEEAIALPARITAGVQGGAIAQTEVKPRSAAEQAAEQATAATPAPLTPRPLSSTPALPAQLLSPNDSLSIASAPPDPTNLDALNAAMERFY